jgi:hypothetical protein
MKEILFDFVLFLHFSFVVLVIRAADLERFLVDGQQGGVPVSVSFLGFLLSVLMLSWWAAVIMFGVRGLVGAVIGASERFKHEEKCSS